jgi:hypothetical protein
LQKKRKVKTRNADGGQREKGGKFLFLESFISRHLRKRMEICFLSNVEKILSYLPELQCKNRSSAMLSTSPNFFIFLNIHGSSFHNLVSSFYTLSATQHHYFKN